MAVRTECYDGSVFVAVGSFYFIGNYSILSHKVITITSFDAGFFTK